MPNSTIQKVPPIENQYFGRSAAEYEARRSGDLWQKEEQVFRYLLSQVVDESENELGILDLPCGTGRWIPFFGQFSGEYCGVDISSDMIAEARQKRRPPNLKTVFIEETWQNFTSGSDKRFDLTVCTRFLGHWNSKEAARIVAGLASVTTKHFILQVRVNDSPLSRILEIISLGKKGPSLVRNRIRKSGRLTRSHLRKKIVDALRESGFSVKCTMPVSRDKHSKFEYWLAQRSR